VEHVGRKSDDLSVIGDELSRKPVSENRRYRKALEKAEFRKLKGYLLRWLENPKMGNLCLELLREIKLKIS